MTKDNGGDGCEVQGSCAGEGYQGRIFEDVEEGDDWCGERGCWEEKVFSEVLGWVGEGDFVKPYHHCGFHE